jgi:hypothetical protein
MKYIIKTRYLPQSSLKIIAKECGVEFIVRLENKKLKNLKTHGRTQIYSEFTLNRQPLHAKRRG